MAQVADWICIPATIEFTVWSDVHKCEGFVTVEEAAVNAKGKSVKRRKRVARGCGAEIVLWDAAVNPETRSVLDVFECPSCQQNWKKGEIPRTRCVAVLTRFEFQSISGKTRALERKLTRIERELTQQIDA